MPQAVCVRSVSFLVFASFAAAQCVTGWQPGTPLPGLDGLVHAMAPWDPDGPGPLPERLAVGGAFEVAGNVVCNRVAIYDPATAQWSALPPLAAQPDRYVKSIVATPTGDLVVGMAGSTQPLDALAFRWNGTSWTALAYGTGTINDLAVMPNGDLLAGGDITIPFSAAPHSWLARWNGTTWTPFAGDVGGPVADLLVTPAGDLVATGGFATAGGVPAANIARWNGSAWSTFGSGLDAAGARICQLPNGDLVVSGLFANAGGGPADRLARWNGTSWSSIGSPSAGSTVQALAFDGATGTLLAGGDFASVGGVPAARIAAWNGSTWSAFTSGVSGAFSFNDGSVTAVRPLANGHVAVGGFFTAAGTSAAQGFGVWAGSQWLPGGNPAPGTILNLAVNAPNDVFAAGLLTIGGASHFVGRWTNGVWSPLGSGVNGQVGPLLRLPNGDLVVSGFLTTAGGVAANYIARWNGSTWSPLGPGTPGPANALALLPNGDIVAAGGVFASPANYIVRWNGTAWSPLGSGLAGPNASTRNLVILPNGDLVVLGWFTSAGGVPANNAARWNGSAWSAMGGGITGFSSSAAVLPNGDLVVSEDYINATLFDRWNGTSWQSLPSPGGYSSGSAVLALPDGDVLAMVRDNSDPNPSRFWRLDSTTSTWTAVGVANDHAYALAQAANGDVYAGGAFSLIDAAGAPRIARLASSCPALATTTGAGCPSSGGANALAATSLPWLGGSLVTSGTGLPNGLTVVVRGFATVSLPLSNVLPQGQPGCVLRVAPDFLDVVVPTNGAATTSLPIPSTLALVGFTFGEQWVPLEIGAAGAIVAATSTNSLTVTIGVF